MNNFPSSWNCYEIDLIMKVSWRYRMITIVSHFNEKNATEIGDICSQNVSPKHSKRKLQSQLLRDIWPVSVHTAVLCGPPQAVIVFIPADLCLCSLHWGQSTGGLNSRQYSKIRPKSFFINSTNDIFLLFRFLSVLIAVELITTLALKIKSPFFLNHWKLQDAKSDSWWCFLHSLPPFTYKSCCPFPLSFGSFAP